ncbi:helix-turn-helix protein [Prauserella shujinwangii]|uniref:Helix-turn-helix protein n=1 Tax=Prauserella shujinwangii TaxID=1453103 RepID=A0A2T0LQ81_9PSEU|nr:helix-turn-helix transcriptional regulator [Prauserella shujinwangii]PRX45460.1 helix-turn-helix protein [Prauserella shujinwangii]
MAPPGRVVPRKLLADELRRLRSQSGKTLEDVAAELMISTSKLSRLENGQGRPQLRDVRDLIRLYGLEGTSLAEQLRSWTRAGQEKPWWTAYSREIPDELGEHVDYEAEAAVARVYTIPAIPVLLQTAEYARAYYRSTERWRSAEEIDALVELRMKRQRALTDRPGKPPLELVAVAHETTIRQLVGSPAVMREQLDHLIERSTAPHVELRIYPFTAPPLFTFTCMYAHFEFAGDLESGFVHIENHAGFRSITTADEVAEYKGHHEELRRHALTPDESRALINSVRQQHFS